MEKLTDKTLEALIRLPGEEAAIEIPVAMLRLGRYLGELITERALLTAERKTFRACEYIGMLSIDPKAPEWKLRARVEHLETFSANLQRVAQLDGMIETGQIQFAALLARSKTNDH